MNARWYAPQTGRFQTPDTWFGDRQEPQTQNLYAYVGNNPMARWDPTGHFACTLGVSTCRSDSDTYSEWSFLEDSWSDSHNQTLDTWTTLDGIYRRYLHTLLESWTYDVWHIVWLDRSQGQADDFWETYDTYQRMSQTSGVAVTPHNPATLNNFTHQERDLAAGVMPGEDAVSRDTQVFERWQQGKGGWLPVLPSDGSGTFIEESLRSIQGDLPSHSTQTFKDRATAMITGETPEARNKQRTAAYAQMYLSNPDVYKWSGMAAYASDIVGVGERDYGDIPGVTSSLELGNNAIFSNLYWQHLAFDEGGIGLLREFAQGGELPQEAYQAWIEVNDGKLLQEFGDWAKDVGLKGNVHDVLSTKGVEAVWQGSHEHVIYEQGIVLQPVTFASKVQKFMGYGGSFFAPKPFPDAQGFHEVVPWGNIADLKDRMKWIEEELIPVWQGWDGSHRDLVLQQMDKLITGGTMHPAKPHWQPCGAFATCLNGQP